MVQYQEAKLTNRVYVGGPEGRAGSGGGHSGEWEIKMKQVFLSILAIFFMVGMAYADFLICDPPSGPDVEYYQVFDNYM